jgi:hypothetical protein
MGRLKDLKSDGSAGERSLPQNCLRTTIQLIYCRNSSCQLAIPPLSATHLQQSTFASAESKIHCLLSGAGVLIAEQSQFTR